MIDLVEWMNRMIEDHAAWVGLAFALIAFAESTAFVGALVPATPVLLMMGSVLGAGKADPWQVVPFAIVGAILGYGLSYALGRLLGRRCVAHPWLRGQRRSIARARWFFSRYGAPSLIFGRYVLGPFQSLIPFVAGSVGMNARRFWRINVVSGLIWVPLTLAPGWLMVVGAERLPIPEEWQQTGTAMIVAISGGAAAACVLWALARGAASLFRRAARG